MDAAAASSTGTERFAELGRIARQGCRAWSQAERRERSAFLRSIYREYDGARLADLDAVADEHLTDHVLARLSPATPYAGSASTAPPATRPC